VRDFVIGPENAIVVESVVRPFLHDTNVEFYPVYIHGSTATGKSHLIQTLASFVPDDSVVTDAHAFSAECIEAIKIDDVPSFERRYMLCRCLFFDDVDHLKDKLVAQQYLRRILEFRATAGRVSVLTAKKPPLSLKLTAGLISRLSQGVVAPLEYPSNSTREELLRVFANRSGVALQDDAILQMAQQNRTAPALLSKLLSLRAHQYPNSKLPADSFETDSSTDDEFEINPKQLIRETAKYYGLKPKDLAGTSRRKQHVMARSMAMFLLRQTTKLSYQEIGHLFGDRDHSTVMHACRKVETLIEQEQSIMDTKSDILSRLGP